MTALGVERGGLRATALACALLLTPLGCSSPLESPSAADTSPSGPTPSFSGPWSAEFAETYSRATTDFERSILADETITEQELSEVRDRFSACLTALGATEVSFEADGAFAFNAPEGSDPETVDEQVDRCADESGESTVGALHSWVRRNPQNLDEDTIMAACLVRKEVVDPSFSAADYAAADGDLPFVESITPSVGEATFLTCNADPLGLFE